MVQIWFSIGANYWLFAIAMARQAAAPWLFRLTKLSIICEAPSSSTPDTAATLKKFLIVSLKDGLPWISSELEA